MNLGIHLWVSLPAFVTGSFSNALYHFSKHYVLNHRHKLWEEQPGHVPPNQWEMLMISLVIATICLPNILIPLNIFYKSTPVQPTHCNLQLLSKGTNP